MATILELLDQIEESETTLKLAESVPVPFVNPQLFKDVEGAPNPNGQETDPDWDPISFLSQVDLNDMSRSFEGGVDQHLQKVKELLRRYYRFLLKVLLVSGGVTSITPKLPKSEIDEKVLEQFGVSLLSEEEEEHGDKKAEAKKAKKLKKRSMKIPEPNSGVGQWLSARGKVIGEHVTKCIDRTIGSGTDYLFSQGLKKISGGRLILPVEDGPKGLQLALQAAKSNADGDKSVAEAVKKLNVAVKLVDTVDSGSSESRGDVKAWKLSQSDSGRWFVKF